MKKFDVAALCRHCNGAGKFPSLEISATGSVTSFFFISMVKLIDNHIHIILDDCYSNTEDLENFTKALLRYITSIEQDKFCETDNFYVCELLRCMLPDQSQIVLSNGKTTRNNFS